MVKVATSIGKRDTGISTTRFIHAEHPKQHTMPRELDGNGTRASMVSAYEWPGFALPIDKHCPVPRQRAAQKPKMALTPIAQHAPFLSPILIM
jgi:hypothetical protein